MSIKQTECLPYSKIDQLQPAALEQRWLIRSLWTREAVGILGGAPKCCKSWLGLDMAISVASGTPCLGSFTVEQPGPVLIYLAEDSLTDVRARVEAICTHRSLNLNQLSLYSITTPGLRLDLKEDQDRLNATLTQLKPRLMVLDPLVRMHRSDENSSADISRILGFLRELQRHHHVAIVLVHHASKRQNARPGQALRGSSDLHAFGDSNAYLARRQDRLVLTLEHRTAKPIDPLDIQLISDSKDSSTHLEVLSGLNVCGSESLDDRIKQLLRNSREPLSRILIRSRLKVNNQRLGNALIELEKQGVITRQSGKWSLTDRNMKQDIGEPAGNPTIRNSSRFDSGQQLSIDDFFKTESHQNSHAVHPI